MNRTIFGILVIVLFMVVGCSTKSPKIKMILVPSGTFLREWNYSNVEVSKFLMSEKEITRKQFEKVMGYDPSDTKGSSGKQDPVQNVNWYEALVYCNKLSIREGLTPVYTISDSTDPDRWGDIPKKREKNTTWDAVQADLTANGYRLPTEIEWLWAAMGADSENPGQVNSTGYFKNFAGSNGSNSIGDYAWHDQNSNGSTHPVGTKMPNELGLYDMSGNVSEWCWDWYTWTFTNYKGSLLEAARLICGNCRATDANRMSINDSRFDRYQFSYNSVTGFRVVRSK